MASSPRTYRSQQRAADADQVELNALRSGRAAITGGADDERMAGVLDDSAVEAPLGAASRGNWATLCRTIPSGQSMRN